jgi:hypothetical protein
MAKKCSIAQTKQYAANQVAHGGERMAFGVLQQRVARLGYKLQREHSYHNNYNPPECWRAASFTTIDRETGKSFAHYQGRRDARYQELQRLRRYAVVLHRGRLVEF